MSCELIWNRVNRRHSLYLKDLTILMRQTRLRKRISKSNGQLPRRRSLRSRMVAVRLVLLLRLLVLPLLPPLSLDALLAGTRSGENGEGMKE